MFDHRSEEDQDGDHDYYLAILYQKSSGKAHELVFPPKDYCPRLSRNDRLSLLEAFEPDVCFIVPSCF